jgi:UDP-2,3-diacylglucosamine pyrophosphatase LpxH
VLLMHGDSLCTRDEGYMKLRRYLRNPSRCSSCGICRCARGTNWRASCAVKAGADADEGQRHR